jgi:hypothetical protein
MDNMMAPTNLTMTDFTASEREYVRRELDQFFGTLPSAADGFQLRIWRGGPHRNQPKLPPAAKSLLERGLMRLDEEGRLPRLFFTDAGMDALKRMMANARLADPSKFAHIRAELGVDLRRNAEAGVRSACSSTTNMSFRVTAGSASDLGCLGLSVDICVDKYLGNECLQIDGFCQVWRQRNKY